MQIAAMRQAKFHLKRWPVTLLRQCKLWKTDCHGLHCGGLHFTVYKAGHGSANHGSEEVGRLPWFASYTVKENANHGSNANCGGRSLLWLAYKSTLPFISSIDDDSWLVLPLELNLYLYLKLALGLFNYWLKYCCSK